MPFQITAQTIIESATIQLTAEQLQDLAHAREALQQLIEDHGDMPAGLQPARNLLNQIAGLFHGTSILTPTKRPPTDAERAARIANAAKGRAAKAARLNSTDGQPDNE